MTSYRHPGLQSPYPTTSETLRAITSQPWPAANSLAREEQHRRHIAAAAQDAAQDAAFRQANPTLIPSRTLFASLRQTIGATLAAARNRIQRTRATASP